MDWKSHLLSPNIKLKNTSDRSSQQPSPLTAVPTNNPPRSPFGSKTYTRQFGKTTAKTCIAQTPEKENAVKDKTKIRCSQPMQDDSTDVDEGPQYILLMPPIFPLSLGMSRPSDRINVSDSLKRLELLRQKAQSSCSIVMASVTETSDQEERPSLSQLLHVSVQSPIVHTSHPSNVPAVIKFETSEALSRLQALRREGNRLVTNIV